MYHIRNVFENHFPEKKISLVYDIAHNIAKMEEHIVNGKKKNLLVIH
jgi:tRNA-splicing ligase RtcB